jgi:hypothetical protein
VLPVSRVEAAQVCVGALLDPSALNKSVYMGKMQKGNKRSSSSDENVSSKFDILPTDAV